MTGKKDMQTQIRDSLRLLWVMTVTLLAAVVAVSVIVWYQAERTGREARRTHDSLCVLRADLRTRVASEHRLLVKHPNGVLGFSRKAIGAQIAGQQRTIDALEREHC